jgi:hypothetical protein
MSDAKIYKRCGMCLGTGIYRVKNEVTNSEIVQDPCETCGGSGYFEDGKIDTTDLMAELDYIHGKVTAIWNKIKDN